MKNIKVLFFYLPLACFAYNLYVDNPVVVDPETLGINNGNKNFFGYTVLLHRSIDNNTQSIFIGAPKANYTLSLSQHRNKIPTEPGSVFKCNLKPFSSPRVVCDPVNVTKPDDEIGVINKTSLNTLIEKAHGWFGASMDIDEVSGFMTVCAPRTNVKVYYKYSTASSLNTMHGVCYSGRIDSRLHMDDEIFSIHDFSSKFWYNPLNGFSVHYPAHRVGFINGPVIGSPKHELFGSIRLLREHISIELQDGDDLAQFGYSITSGNYFNKDQQLIVAGAPGWRYVGQVAVIDSRKKPISIIRSIEGTETGEYFGASLASGDLNNDGLDDLIVGSPHWGNDNGRVQIFFGHASGFGDSEVIIEGKVEDGLYGFSITSGDLDGDGFDDLVVAAPWEGSGVIYVYNGGPSLHVKILEHSQRIEGASIRENLRRFGFSLSKPVDLYNKGVPDIAVGAENGVVVLFARPTVKTEIKISTHPTTLHRNSSSFDMQLCISFAMNSTRSGWYSEMKMSDEDVKRIYTALDLRYYPDGRYFQTNYIYNRHLRYWKDSEQTGCLNTTVHLKKNIDNFIDPIDIIVHHTIKSDSTSFIEKFAPYIEYKGASSTIIRKSIYFDIGCGMDDICHAFIFAKMEFPNLEDDRWIIGSGDVNLLLTIFNHAEPAYLTRVTVHFPEGIFLSSIFPSCQEDENNGSLVVTCDVGNPLEKATEKKLQLGLDMSRVSNGSLDDTSHLFRMDIKTESENKGMQNISKHLHFKADASLSLTGKAEEKDYYFQHDEKKSVKTTFEHTYQISHIGATTIHETRIYIYVPYKIGNSEYLKLLHKPQVVVSGRFYECRVNNITILQLTKQKYTQVETSQNDKSINSVMSLATFAEKVKSRRGISENEYKNLSNPDDILIKRESNNMTAEYEKNIMYLNCSTRDVTCEKIQCNVGPLKTSQNVAKLQIRFVIDTSKLTDIINGSLQIMQFSTISWLEVMSPKTRSTIPGTIEIIPLTTFFHLISNSESVSIWIIILSIILGLLTLLGITHILKRFGFFNRNRKKELDMLRNNEEILLESDRSLEAELN